MAQPQGANLAQNFPQLNSPVLDGNNKITKPWMELFRQLWLRTGGAINGGAPGKAQTITLTGGSPFTFTADFAGTLTSVADQHNVGLAPLCELSRDGGTTFFPVALQGGCIPALAGDKIRLTWLGTTPPITTFFPQGSGT